MRLNRFLAAAGLGSRRGVEELIREGKIRINGHLVEDLATQVGPRDVVKVGNRVVHRQTGIHVALYKPRGFVVTAEDEHDRHTIYELLPDNWPRVFHVGRLDKDSEGLLIVTNDGDLALALTHPRYKMEKEYEVWIDKPFDPALREKLLRGFHIIGGRAKMEAVDEMKSRRLRIILRQGLKRQIRLMLYEVGYEVLQLRRVRIGLLQLGDLRPGEWRLLNSGEIASLRRVEPSGDKPEKPAKVREAESPSTRVRPSVPPAREKGPPRPVSAKRVPPSRSNTKRVHAETRPPGRGRKHGRQGKESPRSSSRR